MTDLKTRISGHCDAAFASVGAEFERNFLERGEVGASVAIHVDGVPVVDLWGGITDHASQRPWEADTLVRVFSCTKAMAGVCMHVLIDRGLLDVDAPVAQYWPEFAENGKAHVTVAMLLSHQAGLPLWQEDLPEDALLDWGLVTSALARQAPLWEPGTCHGYHGMTLGFLEGELVRRITGKSIGTFLREEIAGPLGADVWIGLPETEEARVAPVILADFSASAVYEKMMSDPDWIGTKLFTNVGSAFAPEKIGLRAYHATEAPATGGLATARGLARLFAPLSLDGSVNDIHIVRPRALPAMRLTQSASGCDLMLRLATTFTLGFSKSWGHRRDGEGNYVVLGEQAFGAPGMGGSMVFADSEARMSFGYVMNQNGGGVGLNARGQGLIDAAYRVLGFTSSASGAWSR